MPKRVVKSAGIVSYSKRRKAFRYECQLVCGHVAYTYVDMGGNGKKPTHANCRLCRGRARYVQGELMLDDRASTQLPLPMRIPGSGTGALPGRLVALSMNYFMDSDTDPFDTAEGLPT